MGLQSVFSEFFPIESYDGKCKEGNDALDFRAGDVTRSQMEERNPQDDPAKTDPRF